MDGAPISLRLRATAKSLSPLGLLGALAVVALSLVAPFSSANAQTEGSQQTVQGVVNFQSADEAGERVREPVADVRVLVETEGGELVAEGVTDERGRFVIPVAEPGTYVIRVDPDSLPEHMALTEGQGTFTRDVAANGSTTQLFSLGEDIRTTPSKWSQLPQTVANGLKLATIIAITSIGLSLIFGTTGLSNFGHGEMVTFGALVAWAFNRSWSSVTLVLAALLAVAFGALAGAGMEFGIWRPLRRRGTSLTSMMIVSIGAALAIRHLYLFLAGGDLKQYGQFTLQRDPIEIGPFDFAPRSLWIMGISVAVILAVCFFLLVTRFGKAIRAVSDNPSLASSSGIDSDRVILVVWTLGAALASLGGVFYGLEYGIRWDMGFTLLLLMFAAITLGGLSNPFGALLGALIIGLMVELWTFVVPNANDLKNVGALIALIVLLLVRPQGLLGSKERVG